MSTRSGADRGRVSPLSVVLSSRALALAVVEVSGCQAIAGIKDRHYEPLTDGGEGGAGGGATDAACAAYCKDVMANCTDEFAVYASEKICLAVCKFMPAGDPKVHKGNNLACRARNAKLAGETSEQDVHCPLAGPGGGNECGPDCVSYCDLFGHVCPEDAVDDCVSKCAVLNDLTTFDVVKNHDNDSLQCRLVHSSSASLDPDTHCWHARIAPQPLDGEKSPCANPPDEAPTCKEYCKVAMNACKGDDAVYESETQCEKVCAALDPGTNGDSTGDTVGCRRYHSYNSVEGPDAHCPHAGPGGDGHCGTGNCAPYCRIVKAACGAAFASDFASVEACESACEQIPGAVLNSGYKVSTAGDSGNTVQCRLLYASRAFEDSSACGAALGHDTCK